MGWEGERSGHPGREIPLTPTQLSWPGLAGPGRGATLRTGLHLCPGVGAYSGGLQGGLQASRNRFGEVRDVGSRGQRCPDVGRGWGRHAGSGQAHRQLIDEGFSGCRYWGRHRA